MEEHINHPLIKGGVSAFAFLTLYIDWITTFGKLCGAAVSVAIFSEWVWKRAVKPLCFYMGWMKVKTRWASSDWNQ